MIIDLRTQMHDPLVKAAVDRGLLIEAGFNAMRIVMVQPDASDQHIAALRLAYFAGAQHLWASIFSFMDPDQDPTQADMERMAKVHNEMAAFEAELQQRVRATWGTPS